MKIRNKEFKEGILREAGNLPEPYFLPGKKGCVNCAWYGSNKHCRNKDSPLYNKWVHKTEYCGKWEFKQDD